MTDRERLVFEHLSQFVSDHKKEVIEKVLSARTRQVTVVLEDIFQSQNASAVIRTCECMGIQDIHMVENITKYSTNPKVLKGSNKWIDIKHHASKTLNNTELVLSQLKDQGYKILATDPAEDGISIEKISLENKIAFVFGNELRGVSKEALALCDQKVRIPMYGFTESYNLSVSVAICLSMTIPKMHAEGRFIGLTDHEKDFLKLKWYRKIVRKSDLIEREFIRTIE
ncbi:RNA methyltransferase [Chryseolinea sp. H1M3-3]|uniref:TrmH family RNA methyltransferase n=1 Tax=Chryseolinea sp. H1M3-3 TaxID=3034144 RepID=UPI0023ED98D1|nr:RNA methyltransferase [Chryseolinea sp. H1M3-3]